LKWPNAAPGYREDLCHACGGTGKQNAEHDISAERR